MEVKWEQGRTPEASAMGGAERCGQPNFDNRDPELVCLRGRLEGIWEGVPLPVPGIRASWSRNVGVLLGPVLLPRLPRVRRAPGVTHFSGM